VPAGSCTATPSCVRTRGHQPRACLCSTGATANFSCRAPTPSLSNRLRGVATPDPERLAATARNELPQRLLGDSLCLSAARNELWALSGAYHPVLPPGNHRSASAHSRRQRRLDNTHERSSFLGSRGRMVRSPRRARSPPGSTRDRAYGRRGLGFVESPSILTSPSSLITTSSRRTVPETCSVS
jgi:hypothetical protein